MQVVPETVFTQHIDKAIAILLFVLILFSSHAEFVSLAG